MDPTTTSSTAGLDIDALFTASPEQQKQMLGAAVWPTICTYQPGSAVKIRELMLEMDSNDLFQLIFDEAALRGKIDELVEICAERHDNDTQDVEMKEAQSGENLPEARFQEDAWNLSSCQIDVLCFHDEQFQLEQRIRALSAEDPYTQTPYDEDPEAQHDPNNRVYCVHISDFFTDKNSIVYYIKGTENVKMFCIGMTGMQAFNGAVLFTISPHKLSHILGSTGIDNGDIKRVFKDRMSVEYIKWQYLYETGRLVWSKSHIDLEKLQKLMEKRSDIFNTNASNKSHPSGECGKVQRDRLASSPLSPQDTSITTNSKTPNTNEENRDQVQVPGHELENRKMDFDWPRLDNVIGGTEDVQFGEQAEQQRLNLEIYLKRESHSLNKAWASLKANVLSSTLGDELTDNISLVAKREAELAGHKIKALDIGDETVAATLKHLESCISIDRARLLQEVSNRWANAWRHECVTRMRDTLCDPRNTHANKHELKSWLIDVLEFSIPGANNGNIVVLDAPIIQDVIHLIDSLELERDCIRRIETIKATADVEEKLPALENLSVSLKNSIQTCVSNLTMFMFEHYGHINVQDLNFPAVEHKGLTGKGLTTEQETVLVNTMEAIHTWDRGLVLKLLQESAWVAEAALTKWCDRTKNKDPLSSSKKLGKLPVVEPVVPSSSKKRERQEGPEETLEEARARLEKIIAESQSDV